jgi:molybdate transport system ATP-binding protein
MMEAVMTLQPLDVDPNRLAAVLYRPADDIDTLLADFVGDLVRVGERIGGIVQRNGKDKAGRLISMKVIDVMTGEEISICQSLGRGASACKLDPAGLAEASSAVARAVESDVALIVVNKFSKQEAAGRGLRSELADAIVAGIPVLTAVPDQCIDAWMEFTGNRGTTLLCARYVVEGWWREVSARQSPVRDTAPSPHGDCRDPAAATCRS